MSDARVADPAWFPVGWDGASDAFRFATLDAARLGDAAFLDKRLGVDLAGAEAVPAQALSGLRAEPVAAAPAFLFHTAFCCSTLLARCLHAPPGAMALKEPSLLLRLTEAWRNAPDAAARARVDASLDIGLRLLARPWAAQGRVLVKPTNTVVLILDRVLAAAPDSRAVLLHGGLEDFLVSCAKKLPEAETRLNWMARTVLPGSGLVEAFGLSADAQFGFVEATVLTWYAQMAHYARALASAAAPRLRTLDMDVLLARPADTVAACARWLQLPAALDGLAARVQGEFSHHAKATDVAFNPQVRLAEKQRVLERHGDLVRGALAWARREIEPRASLPRMQPLQA